MIRYHQRKFLAFSLSQQHKKCAELLRCFYQNQDLKLWEHYLEILNWMHLKQPCYRDKKSISDFYHRHLKDAGQCVKEHNLLPRIRTGDEANAKASPFPIAIYLDNLRSAHNVGSIIRTTEALQLGELHFSPTTAFTNHKQVKDAAMGAAEWIVCHPGADLSSLPSPIIAMETSPDAIPLDQFLFPETFTLVIGNEEYGCSEKTLKKADTIIEIPMRGRKNSLNVANAFAMAAGEILRQKRGAA